MGAQTWTTLSQMGHWILEGHPDFVKVLYLPTLPRRYEKLQPGLPSTLRTPPPFPGDYPFIPSSPTQRPPLQHKLFPSPSLSSFLGGHSGRHPLTSSGLLRLRYCLCTLSSPPPGMEPRAFHMWTSHLPLNCVLALSPFPAFSFAQLWGTPGHYSRYLRGSICSPAKSCILASFFLFCFV